jgi:hypothetical protein
LPESSCLTFENRGWKIRPAEKFKGPFGPTNTSFPLLVIGNTADPVCPLASAKKMSKYFKGSVLLTVDTPGVSRLFALARSSQADTRVQHTSLAATSPCSSLAMRSYIRDGVLPKPGTVCGIEDKLFGDVAAGAHAARSEDDDLGSVARKLSKSFKVPMFGRL